MEKVVKHKRSKYKNIVAEKNGKKWYFENAYDLADRMGVNVTQIYAAIRTGKTFLTYKISAEANIPTLD